MNLFLHPTFVVLEQLIDMLQLVLRHQEEDHGVIRNLDLFVMFEVLDLLQLSVKFVGLIRLQELQLW